MVAPGVIVTTSVRSGPGGVERASSGQFFVVGLAERGDTASPTKINGMQDYRRLLGERVAYGTLFDSLALFFETGGATAHVLRAVGPTAAKGFVNVSDAATTPVPTVRVEAASPGSWSSQLTVASVAGTNGATSRRVTVRLSGIVVEDYDNLQSIAQIITKFSTSPYIRVTDLGSASAAPLNMPTTAAPVAVSAGTDDRSNVTAATLTAALDKFKPGLGDGAVAAPGYGELMHAGLIAHARVNRRIALLSCTLGSTVDNYVSVALALSTVQGAEFAGLFGPHVNVSDGAGGSRPVSPEGYVAAARNKAHELTGPWLPPAGEISITPYIVSLETEFTRADRERLDSARVSPVALVANAIRLYGWRSLSANDTDYGSLAVGDLLNRITTECANRLEPYVFRNIDGRGQLFPQIEGVLIGILDPIRAAGGLYERIVDGQQLDPGYSVDVGVNLNSVAVSQSNEVRAIIAGRFSPNAALINLTVVKVGLAAAV